MTFLIPAKRVTQVVTYVRSDMTPVIPDANRDTRNDMSSDMTKIIIHRS